MYASAHVNFLLRKCAIVEKQYFLFKGYCFNTYSAPACMWLYCTKTARKDGKSISLLLTISIV